MDSTTQSFREELICNKKLQDHDLKFVEWILETYCKYTNDRIHLVALKEYQYRMLDMNDF